LYLYKQEYLRSLDVGFPIAWYDKRVDKILELDANDKYITPVPEQELDNGNKTGVPFPMNPYTPGNPRTEGCPDGGPCGDKPCKCE
jgi:hypothetical protein